MRYYSVCSMPLPSAQKIAMSRRSDNRIAAA
jgi:hypothetical protein